MAKRTRRLNKNEDSSLPARVLSLLIGILKKIMLILHLYDLIDTINNIFGLGPNEGPETPVLPRTASGPVSTPGQSIVPPERVREDKLNDEVLFVPNFVKPEIKALYDAIENRDAEHIAQIIDATSAVSVPYIGGKTPLHVAVEIAIKDVSKVDEKIKTNEVKAEDVKTLKKSIAVLKALYGKADADKEGDANKEAAALTDAQTDNPIKGLIELAERTLQRAANTVPTVPKRKRRSKYISPEAALDYAQSEPGSRAKKIRAMA